VKLKIHSYYFSWQKRFFDILLACGLLMVGWPLLAGIAVGILVSGGWPVLYWQQRRGQHGHDFWMYKFRTMRHGAEKLQKRYLRFNQAPAPMFKIFDDPRFFGLGKWLSRTGLDELPQLINILKGEMSFVGPRPLPIKEAELLPRTWDFRNRVKPGVFSEWSVSKERHSSLKKWLELEKKTVSQGGLLGDLRIIARTFLEGFGI
jgi:lipopolysaccharide/colanic/teichoic acid biosynthesis glycosyltransferase